MENHKALLKSYITGFLLSILLTLAAYFVIVIHVNSGHKLISHSLATGVVITLGFLQMIVQMIFFLHMAKESKPRWKLWMFLSFISIVLTVVIASIWIMQHLNYNMTLIKLNDVMQNGEGF
jgi:cytochrome o ubiquinol oxidase subunit IV